MNRKPLYDVEIDEENLKHGVGFISLVDHPAIMVDFIKLSKDISLNFRASKDKQILYGPFLIPDIPIDRYTDDLGEFQIRFKREQIEKIAQRFNEDSNNKNINFMHSDVKVDGYVAENWIIDGTDKSNKWGFELSDGTWFGGVKIKDENFWMNKVNNEEVKGFSVEIVGNLKLSLKKINDNMENTNDKPVDTNVDANLAVDTNTNDTTSTETPAENVDAVKQELTREDVAQMVDARFSSVMEEITGLKGLLEPIKKAMEVDHSENYSKLSEELATTLGKLKDIEEKLSSTPGADSITSKAKDKVTDRFEIELQRVRDFAKSK